MVESYLIKGAFTIAGEEKESAKHRVGLEVTPYYPLEEGESARLVFGKGRGMIITSTVQKIKESGEQTVIETLNTIYVLEKL